LYQRVVLGFSNWLNGSVDFCKSLLEICSKQLTPARAEFNMVRRASTIVLLVLLAACSSDEELAPFASDGCSLFPDASPFSEADLCACCLEHDKAYWKGGTAIERESADQRLADCVLSRTGDEALADAMYEGVRVGGSPYFYNWYRWGYGWSFDRKYQTLTREENVLAAELIAQAASAELLICLD
jgi:hypothetical protein